MIPLPDGWRIGVSCKRTLRERWKQAASLDLQNMDDEKLKTTWHVITYTSDLTVPKVQAIGESRGVVYIPDDDHFFQNHSADPTISAFIRPMTSFISDLKKEIHERSDSQTWSYGSHHPMDGQDMEHRKRRIGVADRRRRASLPSRAAVYIP
jgi:hypothetical protein